jgi:very-short-patch-repair endonuclease
MFRQAPTSAEARLWLGLRRRLVAGFKFRRQHILAGYVVDFYCPALRLVIEVDGGVHDVQRARDAQRTLHLAQLGARVLRIPNARVLSDLPGVLAHLVDICERLQVAMELERASSPPAPPLRRSPNASEKDPPFPRNRGKGAGG